MKHGGSFSIKFAAVMMSSAIFATSASASVVRPHFVFGGFRAPSSAEVTVKLHSAVNFYYQGISSPIINCTEASGKGEILNSGSVARIAKLEVSFGECNAPGYLSTCYVGSLSLNAIESEFGYEPPELSYEVLTNMVPTSGIFGEVDFIGSSCPLTPGKYAIKKGVIAEIPGPYIDTSSPITAFRAYLGVNASHEQQHKEIEVTPMTTTLDELKISTTPVSMAGELEFNVVKAEVTIKTF